MEGKVKVQSPETKEELKRRLRRVEGQVRGVQRMLEDDRDCREIVQQLTAAQAALRNATRVFMRAYAQDCLLDGEDGRSPAEVLDEVLDLLERTP